MKDMLRNIDTDIKCFVQYMYIMIKILVIMKMKPLMYTMILIHMMKYWSRIFQVRMVYILTKEATTLTINTITSLMMIISGTF